LSNDIPNESKPSGGVAIAIATRMGQDKPGAVQGWLGSKNRARAESIVKKSALPSKNLDFSQNLQTGTKRGH
jgi:hypothetical protein